MARVIDADTHPAVSPNDGSSHGLVPVWRSAARVSRHFQRPEAAKPDAAASAAPHRPFARRTIWDLKGKAEGTDRLALSCMPGRNLDAGHVEQRLGRLLVVGMRNDLQGRLLWPAARGDVCRSLPAVAASAAFLLPGRGLASTNIRPDFHDRPPHCVPAYFWSAITCPSFSRSQLWRRVAAIAPCPIATLI